MARVWDSDIVGPESRTLVAARSSFVLVLTGYVVLATWVTAVLRGAEPGIAGWAVMVASLVAYLGALIGLRGEARLWVAFGALAGLLLLLVLPVESPSPWLPVPNLTGSLCYASVLLFRRWWVLVWVTLGVSATAVVFAVRPPQVVLWAPQMPVGLLVVGQLALACALTWWMWRWLWSQAERSDALAADLEASTREALGRQERSREWRRSAIAIHETVLNTIRYVLTADDVDRTRLRSYLDSDPGLPEWDTPSAQVPLADVFSEVDRSVRPDVQVRVQKPETGISTMAGIRVSTSVGGAVRDALVEIARNAHLHAEARIVTVVVEQRADPQAVDYHRAGTIVMTVRDDGRGVPAPWSPGIGVRHAIESSILGVGGTVDIESDDRGLAITMAIPALPKTARRDQPRVSFTSGRLIVTAPLAGWVMGGVVVAAWILVSQGWGAVPLVAAYTAVAGVVASLLFARRRPGPEVLLVAGATAAMIPFLLALGDPSGFCAPQSVAPALVNVTGYAVLTLALWLRLPVLVPAALVGLWAVGAAFLLSSVPSQCREATIAVALNTVIVVPLLLAVAFFGVRQSQRDAARLRGLLDREFAELTRAEVQEEFSSELVDTVARARALMLIVADGGELDAGIRRDLMACDARIRAVIQVDPQRTGSLGLLARDLVEYAVDSGVSVEVRAFDAAADPVEIPQATRRTLEELVGCGDGVVIQVAQWEDASLMSLVLTGVLPDRVREILQRGSLEQHWEILPVEEDGVPTPHVLISWPRTATAPG